MEQETLATPAVEGPGEGTPAQEPGSGPQEPNQAQETAAPQVEPGAQEASSTEQSRPPQQKASYYSQKREFGRLRDTIAEQNRQIAEMATFLKQRAEPTAPSKPNLPDWLKDPEAFWKTPQENLYRLQQEAKEQAKKEALEEFQRYLPNAIQEHSTRQEKERNMQDALEMIFPNKANAKVTLEQRIAADPDRAERIMQILNDKGLNKLSETNPKDAAEFALMIFEKEQAKAAPSRPAPNPTVLKKSLMGPTAAGNKLTPGGEKPMPTLSELRAQKEQMEKQLEENSNLHFDPAFKQKREELKRQMTLAAKELRGDQK